MVVMAFPFIDGVRRKSLLVFRRRGLFVAGFFFVLGFNKCFQTVQVRGPEDTVLLDPGVHGAKRFWIELVHAVAAFSMLTDEMSPPKKPKVFGNSRARDRKSAGDLPGWLAAATEEIKYRPPGGVGEGLKCGFIPRR